MSSPHYINRTRVIHIIIWIVLTLLFYWRFSTLWIEVSAPHNIIGVFHVYGFTILLGFRFSTFRFRKSSHHYFRRLHHIYLNLVFLNDPTIGRVIRASLALWPCFLTASISKFIAKGWNNVPSASYPIKFVFEGHYFSISSWRKHPVTLESSRCATED